MVAAHSQKDDPLHCWTSSSDISGYHVYFPEGHDTIGDGGVAAWTRHAMCESAFTVLYGLVFNAVKLNLICFVGQEQ